MALRFINTKPESNRDPERDPTILRASVRISGSYEVILCVGFGWVAGEGFEPSTSGL